MQWFKHETPSQDNQVFAKLKEEFGLEGYGAWWIICEKVAATIMDKSGRGSLLLPIETWANLTRLSVEKIRNIVKFLADHEIITAEFDGDDLTISCDLTGG